MGNNIRWAQCAMPQCNDHGANVLINPQGIAWRAFFRKIRCLPPALLRGAPFFTARRAIARAFLPGGI